MRRSSATTSDYFSGRGDATPRRRLILPSTIASILLAIVLANAATAGAAVTHEYAGSFPVSFPVQIAVDQGTGQVYVFTAFGNAGYGSDSAIRRFDAEGNPSNFSALGTNQVDGCCGGTNEADQTPNNGVGNIFNGGPFEMAIDSSPGATQHDLIVPLVDRLVFFDSTGTWLYSLPLNPGAGCGVSVDPTGAVFVGHEGAPEIRRAPHSSTVDRFSPGVRTAPQKFTPNSHLYPRVPGVCNVAADSSGGVYVNRSHALKILGGEETPLEFYGSNLFDLILENPGELLENPTEGFYGYSGPDGRKVADRSAVFAVDPSTDDLYATEGNHVVRYDDEGNEVESFGNGDFEHGTGIAVNGTSGRVYVSNLFGSEVRMYDDVVTPDITDISALGGQESATVSAKVAPAGAPSVTGCEVEYGTTEEELSSSVACGGTPYTTETAINAPLTGLATETTYFYRVSAGNGNGTHHSAVHRLTTHAVAGVSTDQPSAIGLTSATLNGSFEGNSEATTHYFEWGNTKVYSHSTAEITESTTGPTPVEADLTELMPYSATAGTYHYRLVAKNSKGTSYGSDVEFHTVAPDTPTIGAISALAVTERTATLSASVDSRGIPTGVRFEYGESEEYGAVIEVDEPVTGSGGAEPVSVALTDLTPGTAYHFRVVASNFNGPTISEDAVFDTPSKPGVSGGEASNVTTTSATIGAGLTSGFLNTTYHFEYGPNLDYGTSAGTGLIDGSSNALHLISAGIAGLTPATTYHYRLVATNSLGTTVGPDFSFSTSGAAPEATKPETQCKNGYVKRHGKCVRRKHKQRHHRRSKHRNGGGK